MDFEVLTTVVNEEFIFLDLLQCFSTDDLEEYVSSIFRLMNKPSKVPA
jgi:hypothetical protein